MQTGEAGFSLFNGFGVRAARVKWNKTRPLPLFPHQKQGRHAQGEGCPADDGRGSQMETVAHSRAWRAVLLLCGLTLVGSAADLRAGTLLTPGPAALVRKSAEPFGVFAFAISGGSMQQKWFRLKEKLDDEMVQLALCDGDRQGCVSPAALKLLAIVDQARSREGRAR